MSADLPSVGTEACIDHGMKGNYFGYANRWAEGSSRSLHRVVYCETRGLHISEIDGKVIRHTCDNPRCINPKHLLIGTAADNSQDRVDRGRSDLVMLRRLTMDQAREIRRAYKPRCKDYGIRSLARKYGAAPGTVHSIVNNRSYKEKK